MPIVFLDDLPAEVLAALRATEGVRISVGERITIDISDSTTATRIYKAFLTDGEPFGDPVIIPLFGHPSQILCLQTFKRRSGICWRRLHLCWQRLLFLEQLCPHLLTYRCSPSGVSNIATQRWQSRPFRMKLCLCRDSQLRVQGLL